MLTKNVTVLSVRELKAKASEILRRLEKEDDLQVIITRYGKPCARLVPLRSAQQLLSKQLAKKPPPSERISLLNAYPDLPEATDEDFEELKRIWEPRLDVLDP